MRATTGVIALIVGGSGCQQVDTPDPAQVRPPPVTSPPTTVREGPPNLLVVLTDDQGVDMVSGWGAGSDPPATPTLDALVDEGVRFTQAWANPTCSPARAALLTGRYGTRTGIGAVLYEEDPSELPLQERTFAELLRQARPPYSTGAVGKWHLSTLSSPSSVDHPNLQGFEHFAGTLDNLNNAGGSYLGWERIEDGVTAWTDDYATTVTVDDALQLVTTLPEPWVVFVSFHAPHAPWAAPPDPLNPSGLTDDAAIPDLYRAMVEALDTELGRLLEGLGGQRARTVVAAMSDNGTPEAATDPPIPGKNTLAEAGLRVPLVVAGPGIAQGVDCDVPVHLVDVLPTLLELAGSDPPTDLLLDGTSLVPWLSDPGQASDRDVVFSEKFLPNGFDLRTTDWRAVRDDRFKYWTKEGAFEDRERALVDLWADDEVDLLTAGPLAPDAAAALDRLSLALDEISGDLGAP